MNNESAPLPSTAAVNGHPHNAMNVLLADCTTLLDVGAGNGDTLSALRVPVKLGLDIYRPYLAKWPAMPDVAIPLNLSVRSLGRVFQPKSVDAVSFIDVIEHLPRGDALAALKCAEIIARRVVFVFTPRGFFPQRDYDAWDLGGEAYQKHRSGWEPEDFESLGFDVMLFPEFHRPENNEAFVRAFGPDAPPVDALLAFKVMSDDMGGDFHPVPGP